MPLHSDWSASADQPNMAGRTPPRTMPIRMSGFGGNQLLSGLKVFQKQFNFVFCFTLESCSRFGYHSVEFLCEMFKLAYRQVLGTEKVGCIGDRDIYLNQSSTAFLFILHLFSFGFIYSGGLWVDLLQFLFSFLGCRHQVIDSKLLVVDHKYRSFFSFSAPLSTAFVLCLLAPPRPAIVVCMHAPPSTAFGPSAPPAGTTRLSTFLCMRLALPFFLLFSLSSFYPVTVRSFKSSAVKFQSGLSAVTSPFRAHPSASVSVFGGGGGDHPT